MQLPELGAGQDSRSHSAARAKDETREGVTDGGGGYQRTRLRFLLSLGRQHLCTVPVPGALIQQGCRERCVACCILPSHSVALQSWGCAQGNLWPTPCTIPHCCVPATAPHTEPSAAPQDSVHWACYTLCQVHPHLRAAGMAHKHFSQSSPRIW